MSAAREHGAAGPAALKIHATRDDPDGLRCLAAGLQLQGLGLDAALAAKGAEARTGVLVIDLRTGDTSNWATVKGARPAWPLWPLYRSRPLRPSGVARMKRSGIREGLPRIALRSGLRTLSQVTRDAGTWYPRIRRRPAQMMLPT
jgi:hypothetical protein